MAQKKAVLPKMMMMMMMKHDRSNVYLVSPKYVKGADYSGRAV
jgi:hypothetical protein